MTLAILCSGQGGQHAGMFELTAAVAAAQPIFAAATAVLGHDPRSWVRAASAAALYENVAAQILCCTQALAAWEALALGEQARHGEVVLAGYSVGELAAWGCAGLFDGETLLQLASVRAQAMDAVASAGTALAAVRGLTRGALEALCRAQGCEIAIVLSPDHYVVGGARTLLERLLEAARHAGAQRLTWLPVAVASHTSLLARASAVFDTRLRAAPIASAMLPGVRLLSGIDGDAVLDLDHGRTKLAQQISRPLDWHACLTACQETGVTRVLELGPGNALAAMAREVIPHARCRGLAEFKSLEGVRSWLADPGPVGPGPAAVSPPDPDDRTAH
jgi:[acyl-carrier-protein] S-malonyltransferase